LIEELVESIVRRGESPALLDQILERGDPDIISAGVLLFPSALSIFVRIERIIVYNVIDWNVSLVTAYSKIAGTVRKLMLAEKLLRYHMEG
jgi:hypothetical protein